MIDTKLRYKFQPLFDYAARGFVAKHIEPNTITLIAFTIGALSAVFIGFNKPILALIFLWLSGLFDVLDGSVARLMGKGTPIGAYMDLILDRMVEAGVIIGFAIHLPQNYFAYLIFLVSVIFNFTTFIVAGALFENEALKSMHYDIGIAERTETFIVFSLMIIFSQYVFSILMIFNVVIFLTGIVRFNRVVKYVNKGNRR